MLFINASAALSIQLSNQSIRLYTLIESCDICEIDQIKFVILNWRLLLVVLLSAFQCAYKYLS